MRCSPQPRWLVLRKDVAIEVKSREILVHDAVLRGVVRAGLRVRVRQGRAGAADDAAAGILWIAIAFSGTLALGRTFERERYGETLRALLLAPAPRPAHLRRQAARHPAAARPDRGAARAAGRAAVQAPLFAGRCCCRALLAAGTIGFAAVGTLFAAMLVRARTRDVLLPILLYPITIPVIIAGVRGTAALLGVAAGRADGDHVDRDAGRASTWCS